MVKIMQTSKPDAAFFLLRAEEEALLATEAANAQDAMMHRRLAAHFAQRAQLVQTRSEAPLLVRD